MSYYKIQTPKGTFRASIEETNDMYKVKYGGKKACVFFSVYKGDDEEYPNLDAIGADKRCNVDASLEDTALLLKSSIQFLIWRFPNIQHIQFLDASTKECENGIKVDLPTFHFAKHGKTWYEDKFGAQLLDRKNKKYFERANIFLEQYHDKESFDMFYKTNVMRFLHNFKRVKESDVYGMLKICWEESNTYKEFFKSIGSRDCILFQHWLKPYILSLWKRVILDTTYWKINRKVIDSWDKNDMHISRSSTKPHYITGGGPMYSMNDFTKAPRHNRI